MSKKRLALIMGGSTPRIYYENLLVNGGFETLGSPTFANWTENLGTGGTIVAEETDKYAGNYAAKITRGTTSQPYVRSDAIAVIPGRKYFFDFFTHGGGGGVPYFHIYNKTAAGFIVQGSYIVSTIIPGTNTLYRRWIYPVTIPAGCLEVYLFFLSGSVEGNLGFFDSAEFYRVDTRSVFYDGFKTDGELRRSPSGHHYNVVNTGNTGNMAVINGVMDVPVANQAGAGYLYTELAAAPTKMTAKIIFKDDGAAEDDAHSIAVLACSSDYYNFYLYKNMIHAYITPVGYHIDIGNAGSFTTIANGVITPGLTPGAEYEFSISISGDTITMQVPTIAEPVVVTHADVSLYHGKYVFYEIYKGNATCRTPTFTYIRADF